MQDDNYDNQSGDSEKLSKVSFPNTPFPNSPDCLTVLGGNKVEYEIEDVKYSHPSRLFFVREVSTGKQFVIKALVSEKNDWCNLSDIGKRQQAQLYAAQYNKRTAPDVYFGLAPLVERSLDCFAARTIHLGRIIEHPEPADMDASSEYAVVMAHLPSDRQLSAMLKNGFHLDDWMMLVIKRIVDMHQMLEEISFSNQSGKDWGSYQQLQRKLQNNIDRAGSLPVAQPAIFKLISESLLEVFQHSIYQRYFEQRRRDGYIKNCHGDLKTQNIWIITPRLLEEPWQGVKILDCIDFNLEYSNIDILSDFAMLVVDVHARTNLPTLVKKMIDWYLEQTHQENEVARFVLDYYLLEKALVRASMRSASENLREPDQTFLDLATEYRERLLNHMPARQLVHS